MNLVKFENTLTMTSLELREVVNAARQSSGEARVRNDQFTARIEDELEGELSGCKTFAPAGGGTPMRYYDLTLEQCLLVGMRESKAVRRAVLDRLKELEIQAAQTRADELARLHARNAARLEHAPMTLALKDSRKAQGKDTQHFHYSNEANMINRIVIGTTAKKFKEVNELNDSDHLRDHLSTLEVTCIEHLQKVNTSLLTVGLDYDTRKGMLTKVYNEQYKDALIIEAIGLCG